MKFLITGGAGFIGSHLAEFLLAQDHQVSVIDDYSTGSPDNIAPFITRLDEVVVARLDDNISETLLQLVAAADIVIHLAASVGVQLILDQTLASIDNNIYATGIVLDACRFHRKRVLIASSSEVYGKSSKVPFSEDDDVTLGPTTMARWSYAASKMLDEFMALAYHREQGLDATVFRLFNTVGPRQSSKYGMVIPTFVQKALRGEHLPIHGGAQTRTFCHVHDVCRAIYDLAMHGGTAGHVFNIGGEEEIEIQELASRIVRKTGSSSGFIIPRPEEGTHRPGFQDVQRRVPNTTRILEATGWRPHITLDGILDQVIEHERARLAAATAV